MVGMGLGKVGFLQTPLTVPSAWGWWGGLGACLLLACLFFIIRRLRATKCNSGKPGESSPETCRRQGLAFLGQGQFDAAFEQLRQCPLDPGLMGNLYNLALGYEGKRQFSQAEAVFRHMAAYDLNFRDLPQRLARIRQRLESTATVPGLGTIESTATRPERLGRYRIEKELGKGAMGAVYLGRDPESGRLAAIKTLALAREFDPDAIDEARARFFREAETAGRLQHPNIVAIHEAGEADGLAYIAMEFLAGSDLTHFAKSGRLLPLSQVLSIAARVAEALDYAHRHQVVHRDIKPANILYEPQADLVKVTDFGIARITDSAHTRTGMVLGSPAYMSPEQLAGKKVDGRSDLYSLGVTLYQLCCGRQPFAADSLGGLMARIANEPPADIGQINPALPPAMVAVIAKLLSKDPGKRHQSGGELAGVLRACLAGLSADGATPEAQGEERA